MPIVCTESMGSRQVTDGQSAELAYTVRGTADESIALAALRAASPGEFSNLVRQALTVEPVHVDSTRPDTCIWAGTVRYAPRQEQQQTGESSFSFDTGGGTQHVTQSLQTVGRYPGNAPDFGGAIGVTHDNVEGVDITVPIYQFSETHYLPAAVVTLAYRGTLFYLTGKVNSSSFRGMAPGECLFLGASGSRRGTGPDDDWEISFKFASSPNASGLQVGSIGGISKKGWEYMWVRYQDAEDENAKVLIKKPLAVYIEKVYEQANFAALGIGT